MVQIDADLGASRLSKIAVTLLLVATVGCAPSPDAPEAISSDADEFTVARDAYEARQYTSAYAMMRTLAENGDPRAAFLLGDMYDYGLGTDQDYFAAFDQYYAAALRGHAEAQYRLAARYRDGLGVERDSLESWTWHKIALDNPALSRRSRYWADIEFRSFLSVNALNDADAMAVRSEAIRRAEAFKPLDTKPPETP